MDHNLLKKFIFFKIKFGFLDLFFMFKIIFGPILMFLYLKSEANNFLEFCAKHS